MTICIVSVTDSFHLPRRVQASDQAVLVNQTPEQTVLQEHPDAPGHLSRRDPQLPARGLLQNAGTS